MFSSLISSDWSKYREMKTKSELRNGNVKKVNLNFVQCLLFTVYKLV